MMQEPTIIGPANEGSRDVVTGQRLAALLALVGARRMDVEELREKVKLNPHSFGNLLKWLQREYLVDIVSTLEEDRVEERAVLTDRGEAVLVGMLERTCELPELH